MSKNTKRNPYFAESIKMLRLQYDMTQEEFALALGLAPASSYSRNLSALISGWERGEREPSLEMVTRICKHFGVSADWILGIDEKSSNFSREARLMLLNGENTLNEDDKTKLLKIIKAFTETEPYNSRKND